MALLKKTKIAVVLAALYTLSSCAPETCYLDAYVCETAVDLTDMIIDSMEVQDVVSNVFVVNDTVKVSLMEYSRGQNVLDVRHLGGDEGEGILTYGPDDGELMSAIPGRHDGMLLIQDFVKDEIHVIDLSSLDDIKISKAYASNIHSQAIVPMSMDWGVFLNASSKQRKRILKTAADFKYPGRKPKPDRINVSHGSIVANEGADRYAFLDRIQSRIEIYDGYGRIKNLIQKKTLEDQQYDIDKEGYPVFLNSFYQSFTDGCEYNDGFVALYRPGCISPQSENLSPWSYILFFDWYGNILKSYKKTSSIMNLSISQDGSHIFLFEEGPFGRRLCTYAI